MDFVCLSFNISYMLLVLIISWCRNLAAGCQARIVFLFRKSSLTLDLDVYKAKLCRRMTPLNIPLLSVLRFGALFCLSLPLCQVHSLLPSLRLAFRFIPSFISLIFKGQSLKHESRMYFCLTFYCYCCTFVHSRCACPSECLWTM